LGVGIWSVKNIEENCGESGDGEFLGGKNFIEGYDDFFLYLSSEN
jgi:hypothetical protein